MTTTPSASPRRNVQLAGRAFATLVFAVCAFPMARNLLMEPRRSPFDVVLWSGGLALSLLLVVLGTAALLDRPILGPDRFRRRPRPDGPAFHRSGHDQLGGGHRLAPSLGAPMTGGSLTALAIVIELWRDHRRARTATSPVA